MLIPTPITCKYRAGVNCFVLCKRGCSMHFLLHQLVDCLLASHFHFRLVICSPEAFILYGCFYVCKCAVLVRVYSVSVILILPSYSWRCEGLVLLCECQFLMCSTSVPEGGKVRQNHRSQELLGPFVPLQGRSILRGSRNCKESSGSFHCTS